MIYWLHVFSRSDCSPITRQSNMSSRKGRRKDNIAGEKYDSNAIQLSEPVIKSTPGSQGPQMPKVPHKDTKYFSTETPVDCSRWPVLYPNYIDSKKTIPQGRRVSKENACPDPAVQDMAEVCRYLKLDHVMEVGSITLDPCLPVSHHLNSRINSIHVTGLFLVVFEFDYKTKMALLSTLRFKREKIWWKKWVIRFLHYRVVLID